MASYHAGALRSAADTAAAATTGLQLLQTLVPGAPAGSSVGLHVLAAPSTHASCSSSTRAAWAAAAAASLAALAKVAGTELAASLRSSSLDAATPRADAAAAPVSTDAYGTAGSGGAVLRARLLHQPTAGASELPNSHLMPVPRGSLANLRPVPHAQAAPGSGEVKVCSGACRPGSECRSAVPASAVEGVTLARPNSPPRCGCALSG